MGASQRLKGSNFERKVAQILRDHFPTAQIRRSWQSFQAFESDVVVEGEAPKWIRRLWFECMASVNPGGKMIKKIAQAERDAEASVVKDKVPAVVWTKTGDPRVFITLRLERFLQMMWETPWEGA